MRLGEEVSSQRWSSSTPTIPRDCFSSPWVLEVAPVFARHWVSKAGESRSWACLPCDSRRHLRTMHSVRSVGWKGKSRFLHSLTRSIFVNLHACTCRYAAIDPGSTASRAVIVTTVIEQQSGKRKLIDTIRIQETRPDDDQIERFTRGEWPSTCCPFDGPPYHVGYDAAAEDRKRNISIKAIPYFRTQDDDHHPFTKALYDHSKSLPSDTARRHFNDMLDDILFRFLYAGASALISLVSPYRLDALLPSCRHLSILDPPPQLPCEQAYTDIYPRMNKEPNSSAHS